MTQYTALSGIPHEILVILSATWKAEAGANGSWALVS